MSVCFSCSLLSASMQYIVIFCYYSQNKFWLIELNGCLLPLSWRSCVCIGLFGCCHAWITQKVFMKYVDIYFFFPVHPFCRWQCHSRSLPRLSHSQVAFWMMWNVTQWNVMLFVMEHCHVDNRCYALCKIWCPCSPDVAAHLHNNRKYHTLATSAESVNNLTLGLSFVTVGAFHCA